MIKKRSLKTLATGLMLLGASVMSASAATLYVTNFSSGQILSLNTLTKATTVVATVGNNPDSIVFDSAGRIIYSVYNTGQVRVYNIGTATDSLLASGFSNFGTVDLALEPGGATVLLSDRGNSTLRRINVTTGATTNVGSVGAFSGLNGIAYDGSGNLYVALGNNTVVQVNPSTGAVIRTSAAVPGGIDGMTYDSVSNKLWTLSGCLSSLDLATLTPSACVSGSTSGDGVVSDGAGSLYLAAGSVVQQYTISSGVFSNVSNTISGLDDIAPASGLGAPVAQPSNTPVPSSLLLILVGMGIVALFGAVRKVRASAAV